MKRLLFIIALYIFHLGALEAETFELIKFGDFNSWVTRNIKESALLGGNQKIIYAIGPTRTIDGNIAYNNTEGSPWGTSNVYAKVMGVVKGSNTVFPDVRAEGDKCVKMTTILDNCKAVGVINIDVLVAGSIFLGQMLEPVSSTSNPYAKMEYGMSFNRRPKALRFDYKLYIPEGKGRIYSSGFGKKKQLAGNDKADVYIMLQRRWEDSEGNIHALRVGTGRQHFGKSTAGWVNGYEIPVLYGDITKDPEFKPYMDLIPEERSYYARNSKGKMVPVVEEGWDSKDAIPTHVLIMASTSTGEAYLGTIGLTLWLDNIGFVY